MPVMLKQKGTGDLFGFTPIMAARADMEPFEVSDLSPVAKPKRKRAKKPKVVEVAVEETVGVGEPEAEPAPLEGLDELFKGE